MPLQQVNTTPRTEDGDAPSHVAGSQLLGEYREGQFFLAAPRYTLRCEGTLRSIPGNAERNRLTEATRSALADAPRTGGLPPRAVGAIPFDHTAQAQLVIPETARIAAPLAAAPQRPTSHVHAIGNYEITAEPSTSDHVRAVSQALARLRSDEALHKVVLARTLRLTASAPIDAQRILSALAHRDPSGYTFAVDLPGGRSTSSRRTLLGASPELLVSRRGRRVVSGPLAGSMARGTDPEEDRHRGRMLLASQKDRVEHAIVVKAICDVLRPLCRDLDVSSEPSLARTAAMWHLSSTITATLADPDVTALDLALALHPTPAVCGSPTANARQAIADIETFDRDFYAGIVGWCDTAGDGDWAIAIRCAETEAHTLRMFAGGGIVAESEPEAELAETSAKFQTFLDAID